MKIKSQNLTGLLPGHSGVAPIVFDRVRATIPAREALTEAGATVEPTGDTCTIRLGGRMPCGIVAVSTPDPNGGADRMAIRMRHEPPYPIERPDVWAQADWTPCPDCGAPIVWYESGYVPGYRVCAKPPHHHSIVA